MSRSLRRVRLPARPEAVYIAEAAPAVFVAPGTGPRALTLHVFRLSGVEGRVHNMHAEHVGSDRRSLKTDGKNILGHLTMETKLRFVPSSVSCLQLEG